MTAKTRTIAIQTLRATRSQFHCLCPGGVGEAAGSSSFSGCWCKFIAQFLFSLSKTLNENAICTMSIVSLSLSPCQYSTPSSPKRYGSVTLFSPGNGAWYSPTNW